MSVTHTHRQTILAGGVTVCNAAESVTADGELVFDGIIDGSTLYAANEIDLAFDPGLVASLVIVSDKAIGLKTNDPGGPADDTYALLANSPLVWKSTDLTDIPIVAAAVTKFYANNGTAGNAHLQIHVLLDVSA